jgi:hypothetical protein
VPPLFISFSPKLIPAFRHMPPLIWHRPGSSLRGVFSEEHTAKPMQRSDIDQAVRALYRGWCSPSRCG